MKHSTLTRREFIKITAIAGGLVAGGSALRTAFSPKVCEIYESRVLMGTIINLTLVSDDQSQARLAIAQTFSRLADLVQLLDHRQTENQLGRLNSSGTLSAPSPDLVYVLEEAVRYSTVTGGAFDISIKPLVDLYRNSVNDEGSLPADELITASASLVDFRQIRISADEVSFAKPGMQITLDGIAKGYIIDQGATVLQSLGFTNVLVEAGGDLVAAGSKSGSPWRIGVQSPRQTNPGLLAKIDLSNQAAATSGDYMNAFTEDMTSHHIIDPRTGISSPELASVTVIATSALEADALATSLMVLGVKDGLELIERLDGVQAYLVEKNLSIHQSRGVHPPTMANI